VAFCDEICQTSQQNIYPRMSVQKRGFGNLRLSYFSARFIWILTDRSNGQVTVRAKSGKIGVARV
jgi:hypothetical protein